MEKRQLDRVVWIDSAKIISCVLIVIGHLLRGLSLSGILSGPVSDGIVRALYFFHVQVFFFCSGFLYRRNCGTGFSSWGKNILKKLLDLGVPYLCFTAVSYTLKVFFENDINDPVHASFPVTLLSRPEAPYWFLYILFFMFLLIPPVKSKKTLYAVFAASIVLFAVTEIFDVSELPYFLKNFMKYAVWFVLGMLLFEYRNVFNNLSFAKSLPAVLFVPAVISVCAFNIDFPFIEFIMCVWGIAFTVTVSVFISDKFKNKKMIGQISEYIMPVFLMHTLASPMVRVVLLKIGITSSVIHLLSGFILGILLPSVVYLIMHLLVVPEFIIYPRKTVKRIKSRKKAV